MENRRVRVTPVTLERGRWRIRIVALVVGGMVAASVLVVHGRYELTHDLPNPYWGIFPMSYSYTPEQGPPGAGLMETRPDEISLQFIRDYISVAGTFPCVASLASYSDDSDAGDPVLDESGKPCEVHRPVHEVRITLVYVVAAFESLRSIPEATVYFHITYTDGEQLTSSFLLIPDMNRSYGYYLTYIHANCWFLWKASFNFYADAGREPPRGLIYSRRHEAGSRCAGFA